MEVARKVWLVLVAVCMFVTHAKRIDTKRPIEITEDNWRDVLEGQWLVEFMAPWCPACRSFKDTWDGVAKWTEDLEFKVGVVDVTQSPGLSGRFFVTALPTIYHVKDGVFRQYQGPRKENDFVSYVDDAKWEKVEPVSWYLNPNSIQMSTVGLFFKVAMVIRAFYNTMVTEYGIPEWGCYLIFAVMTIIAGLFFGLLIVCCCDILFPPKYLPKEHLTRADNVQNDEGENQDDESDILDDTKTAEEDGNTTTRRRHPKKDG